MYKREFTYQIVVFFLLLINSNGYSQLDNMSNENTQNNIVNDTVKIDTLKTVERLEDVLIYDSDDQIHRWKDKMSYLLRNAIVKYTDMEIYADYIEINWETGDVYADGERDSTGLIIKPTIFKQAGQEYEQHSFKVNFKTKVGIAYNVRINEGEGVLVGDRVKRVNDSIMYLRRADYTTDTYFIEKKTNDPDYVLRTSKAKLINNKVMVTGPINMRIYDVPTPLTLPFAYLPMSNNRTAGIIIPSFGERSDVGFFLSGGGFYLPIGDYLDISLTGEIYTKGSWGIHANSAYRKIYRFNGGFRLDYENKVTGIKGLDDYNKATNYRVSWNHSQDPKANPNLIFSAHVDFSSSQYFRQSINNQNVFNGDVYTNSTSSSISLNKNFPNSPFTMSLTSSLYQNNNLSSNEPATMQLTMPQLTVNMSRIYPFAPKVGSKKGLIKNLAVGYNLNIINNINTNEDDIFTSRMWDNAKNGARQNLNLNTGTTLANYFPVTFSAGYNEVWTLKTIEKTYDTAENKVIDKTIDGFDSYRTFDLSTSVSTNLYGLYQSKNENATIRGIRHVISPSIGFTYKPDFGAREWGYYNTLHFPNGEELTYSRFEGGYYGSPSRGENMMLSFGIRNNLEMKVRSKTDSTGSKKVKIFDYLDINSAYNFAAEEFKLSPIRVSGVTKLFNQQLSLQFNATFDPYKLVFEDGAQRGTRVNELGSLRLTDYSLNFGYNFSNTSFGGKKFDPKNYKKQGTVRNENFYFDEFDYAHFAIPWRLNLSVSHSYRKYDSRDSNTSTVMTINGSISPSPYWSISGSSSYDFVAKEFSQARFTFNRDLRSFNISFSWVPFGLYKTWDFFIGIKASILSDVVKYDERSSNIFNQSNF